MWQDRKYTTVTAKSLSDTPYSCRKTVNLAIGDCFFNIAILKTAKNGVIAILPGNSSAGAMLRVRGMRIAHMGEDSKSVDWGLFFQYCNTKTAKMV